MDSGVTHHVNSNLQNLNIYTAYGGTDELFIIDGTSFSITHIGSTFLNSPSTSFHLNNVLCVPKSDKNLILVSQLYDNNFVLIDVFLLLS